MKISTICGEFPLICYGDVSKTRTAKKPPDGFAWADLGGYEGVFYKSQIINWDELPKNLGMIRLDKKESNLKPMRAMKPLEVCVVHEDGIDGDVVMRTASVGKFEVINLSNPGPDRCWEDGLLKVRGLYPGEKYTLELS